MVVDSRTIEPKLKICIEGLKSLHSKLSAQDKASALYSYATLFANQYDRICLWAHDVKVWDSVLDKQLKMSSSLRDCIWELLSDLAEQHDVVPSETTIKSTLEEVTDIVDNLISLEPALRSPAPLDQFLTKIPASVSTMSHGTNSQTRTLILEDSSLASGQVWDFIDKAMVKQSIKLRRFLPRRALENASQKQIVFRVIKEDPTLDGVVTSTKEMEEFAEEVFKNARKLFLACIYCNLPMRCLWMFWKSSITDKKLPLGEQECPEDYKREYNSAFLSSQHLFLAPSFEPGRSWNFTYDEIIPLSYSESKRYGKGGFGSVYPVTIHPDHHTLHPIMNDFAIKVFDNRAIVNSATGYLREREVHMGIAGLNHKHLVKMLTSFTYEGNYYMIFPFANCDLWDYMEKNPKFPYNDPKKIFWLITQVVGLAEALEKIHRPGNASRFGQLLDTNLAAVDADSTAYHHDIKHDNILLFIEDEYPEGILRLSDFGCGKVATLLLNAAGKKESHRTPTKGNPTFEAPEGFSGSTSRPYNIWSIACVFLELLVWAVQGFPKISQFEQNISSPVSQERPTEDGRFYYLEKGGRIYLKQAVQDKISELKGLTKDNEVLHQLLEVLVKLLVIEPEKRPEAPELVKMLRPLKSLAEKKLRSSDRPISGSKVTAVSPSVQRSYDNIPEVKITEAKL